MSAVYPSNQDHNIFVICPGEKIGVDTIRMKRAGTFSTAIVQTVARADHLLCDWKKCEPEQFGCEFEVRFVDGCVLSGSFDLGRSKSWRASLRKHLEKLCANMVLPHSTQSDCSERKFLDVYEFDA